MPFSVGRAARDRAGKQRRIGDRREVDPADRPRRTPHLVVRRGGRYASFFRLQLQHDTSEPVAAAIRSSAPLKTTPTSGASVN